MEEEAPGAEGATDAAVRRGPLVADMTVGEDVGRPPAKEAASKETVFGSEGGCRLLPSGQEAFRIADGSLYSILTPSQATAPGATDKRPPQHQEARTRGRRRAKWKLKFHHQALPPEYLDHYEAAMAQEARAVAAAVAAGPAVVPGTSKQAARPSGAARGATRKAPGAHDAKGAQEPAKAFKTEPAEGPGSETPSPRPASEEQPEKDEKRSSVIIAAPEGFRHLPFMGEMTLDSKPRRGRKPKKADICHLIYKNYGTVLGSPRAIAGSPAPSSPSSSASSLSPSSPSSAGYKIFPATESLLAKRLTQSPGKREQDEPLNLCIRDLMRINVSGAPAVKAEPAEEDARVAEAGPGWAPDGGLPAEDTPAAAGSTAFPGQPGNYIYWPNAGVFVHPMAVQSHLLYCQKMAPVPPDRQNRAVPGKSSRPDLPPDHAVPLGRPVAHAPEEVVPAAARKRAVPSSSLATKRKRSAIFIPPTAENPTEVSICKFKFTGGAKPSLEEKKMLSVDAGGNFRYYSGTGDKSMRGYEFFPREQTLASPSTSREASLAGEQPPARSGPSSSSAFHGAGPSAVPEAPVEVPHAPEGRKGPPAAGGARRKRRTRKSLVREKLEQTFREKGFLIQTQQLESAEGATYCKFRQLRKFTRYLFRSWKDYLPGNIKEISSTSSAAAAAGEPGGEPGGETPAVATPIDPVSLLPTE